MTVTIEANGRILRGTAVAFNEPAVVVVKDEMAEEIFDTQSFDKAPSGIIPLLVNHDRSREPVGVVRSTALRSYGLSFESELLVSDADLQVWSQRFTAGLVSGVSMGFLADQRRTVRGRPKRRGDLPIRRPRGVVLDELSLIVRPNMPAFDNAQVSSLSVRTAADQRRHVESERIIHEWDTDRILRAHKKRLSAA